MKIRTGFVSNSSSSSFVIALKDLTDEQVKLIMENDYKDQEFDDPWEIKMMETEIMGGTIMTNYSMEEFLEKIGVPSKVIKWDNSFWDGFD